MHFPRQVEPMRSNNQIQLNAPAGTLPALIAAVDAGADSVYVGFRTATNLRNLPGLNFSIEEAAEGVGYAHRRGVKVFITVNTCPADHQLEECFRAIDSADDIGADAVIIADWALLEYARARRPRLAVHLSCVAGAADAGAVCFYREEFGVDCVILPRVMSLEQIGAVRSETDVLLEVMVFGVLCANYEGRCCLSSYITGISANSVGACAPPELVEFEEADDGRMILRLNGIAIDDFATGEQRTYPTPCKGKYHSPAAGRRLRAFQDPCGLNALSLLPEIAAAGVNVVKIEGRQRSLAYVKLVTSVWRDAIDELARPGARGKSFSRYAELQSLIEGNKSTLGALGGG